MNLRLTGMAAIATLCSALAAAQGYPAKPVRLIVPFPPGGPNDIIGRIVAQKLNDALGQPVLVDNRAGAGGNTGTALVAKAPPDGLTLLSGGMGSLIMNPVIEKVPYDPLRDFAPVILMATAPNVLVVHPSLPVRDVKSLIALARSRPGDLNFGSGGVGSTPHLSGALFNTMAKINIVHIPYKGNAPAVTDLIGGQVQLAFLGVPPARQHVENGKLRAIAVTSLQRSQALPATPTIAESGLPGYELSPWYGLLAPAKTPAAIVTRLNAEVAKIVRTADTVDKFMAVGAEPVVTTPEEYAAQLKADLAKWTRVIREAGITGQ